MSQMSAQLYSGEPRIFLGGAENCMKMKEFGWGRASLTPLRSATALSFRVFDYYSHAVIIFPHYSSFPHLIHL